MTTVTITIVTETVMSIVPLLPQGTGADKYGLIPGNVLFILGGAFFQKIAQRPSRTTGTPLEQ